MSLLLRGVPAKAQVSFPISYKGKYLGEYAADWVVDEKVIVELKCAAHQLPEAQGGMETSPPGSLIWYIRPTTVVQLSRGHYTSRKGN